MPRANRSAHKGGKNGKRKSARHNGVAACARLAVRRYSAHSGRHPNTHQLDEAVPVEQKETSSERALPSSRKAAPFFLVCTSSQRSPLLMWVRLSDLDIATSECQMRIKPPRCHWKRSTIHGAEQCVYSSYDGLYRPTNRINLDCRDCLRVSQFVP